MKTSDTFTVALERAANYANECRSGLGYAMAYLDRHGWAQEINGISCLRVGCRKLYYLNSGEDNNMTLAREGCGDIFLTTVNGWRNQIEAELKGDGGI